ncbi:hypothetical protein N1851_016021 [Merluccius polli]|uniref:Reverse transcriptase domain-containing protein n=1 Tax=Merluccius polli TaxID=89951 RepID=A0AA47MS21_MERPO|nr:hypothetical protein N1851_016021 [Merluccius polli]
MQTRASPKGSGIREPAVSQARSRRFINITCAAVVADNTAVSHRDVYHRAGRRGRCRASSCWTPQRVQAAPSLNTLGRVGGGGPHVKPGCLLCHLRDSQAALDPDPPLTSSITSTSTSTTATATTSQSGLSATPEAPHPYSQACHICLSLGRRLDCGKCDLGEPCSMRLSDLTSLEGRREDDCKDLILGTIIARKRSEYFFTTAIEYGHRTPVVRPHTLASKLSTQPVLACPGLAGRAARLRCDISQSHLWREEGCVDGRCPAADVLQLGGWTSLYQALRSFINEPAGCLSVTTEYTQPDAGCLAAAAAAGRFISQQSVELSFCDEGDYARPALVMSPALPPRTPGTKFLFAIANRSTEDAICTVLHTTISHLEQQIRYARLLFVDFSTILPDRLTEKLLDIRLPATTCCWITDFLSNRVQRVRVGAPSLNSPQPQHRLPTGLCTQSSALHTHDCVGTHPDNITVKFADDTTLVGLISGGDEAAYREGVQRLVEWCDDNNLVLNTSKTKEMIVRRKTDLQPICINGESVERVHSLKFLGVHMDADHGWSSNTAAVVKSELLTVFYHCSIESVLTYTMAHRKAPPRVINTAQRIIGHPLPSLQDLYSIRCLRKARSILKDSSHPGHRVFQLLPSGRRFRMLKTRTNRIRDGFYDRAIALLNENS